MPEATARSPFSRINLRPTTGRLAFGRADWKAVGAAFGVRMPRPYLDMAEWFGAGQFASPVEGGLDQFVVFSPDDEGGHGTIESGRISMERVSGIFAEWRADPMAARNLGDRKAIPFAETWRGPRFYLAFGADGAFRGVMRREADGGAMSLATFAGFLALLGREAAAAPEDADAAFKAAERRWLQIYGEEAGA